MPETNETKAVIARKKQSEKSKRATMDMLRSKRSATTEFSIFMRDGDETTEVTLKYKAIGAKAYDELVSKHPPTREQRTNGSSFNIDTFAPALIAACCVEPEMTAEDAKELWQSDDWSRGDLLVLFSQAVELNNRGIDIPFSGTD